MRTKLFCLMALLISGKGVTDEYHYNNLLIGGSAVGFGGAYTAIADDLSSMHYNPAGLVHSQEQTSASINAMSWEKTTFEQVFSNGQDFDRSSFTIIPSFFAFKADFERWSLGAFFAVADFSKERNSSDIKYEIPATQISPVTQANEFVYIDMDNNVYKLGGSAALQFNENLYFGLSLFIQYSEFKTMQGSGVELITPFDNQDIFSGFHGSLRMNDDRIDIEPIFGILWKNNSVSFGAKIAKPLAVSRAIDLTSAVYAAGPQTLQPNVRPASLFSAKSNTQQKTPLQITLANAYFFDNLTLSVSLDYYSKVSVEPEIIDDILFAVTRDKKQVINFAAGIEYQLSAKNSINLGVFTDKSNGKMDPSFPFQRVEYIDLIGLSLAYNSNIIGNKITFGLYYKYGKGEVRYSDVRAVEQISGLPLYPNNNNFDITKSTKKQLTAYLSLSF